jgi:glutathione S-transferase
MAAPTELFSDPQFRLYALTSSILALHLLALAAMTGGARTKAKKYVNPEDAAALKGSVVEIDVDPVLRLKRAHLNALENAVPFFVIGFLYVLSGCSQRGATIYFWTFVAARLLHSVFYLAGKQPWRTVMFAIGSLAVAGMAVQVLIRSV